MKLPAQARQHTALPVARGKGQCKATATDFSVATPHVQHLMQTIKEDSKNMFTDKGIDISVYSDNVDFKDPITKYDSASGFAKNLRFLKKAFDPSYDILDMRAVNATDFEARWSMGFELQLIRNTPLRKYWQPRLAFTGITYYGTDAETGLIDQHLDYWDNIENQKYFSFEAFGDVLRQMFSLQRTPDLQTPDFTLLKRKRDYSIREYQPFVVAQTPATNDTQQRKAAFRTLARYLFGGNPEQRKLSMTTPVITSGSVMQFVLPVQSPQDAPQPGSAGNGDAAVIVQQERGGRFAVLGFSGRADAEIAAEQTQSLLRCMQRDGLQPSEDASGQARSLLLQYNDPGVKPPFRTNEVMVPIASGFDLWDS